MHGKAQKCIKHNTLPSCFTRKLMLLDTSRHLAERLTSQGKHSSQILMHAHGRFGFRNTKNVLESS